MQTYLDHARNTLSAFERLIERAEDIEHEELAIATRCLVRLRDAMIADRRQEDGWKKEDQDILDRVNSMLSIATSAEFPIVGVRWKRLCMLRDALRQLINEWERAPDGFRRADASTPKQPGAAR